MRTSNLSADFNAVMGNVVAWRASVSPRLKTGWRSKETEKDDEKNLDGGYHAGEDGKCDEKAELKQTSIMAEL